MTRTKIVATIGLASARPDVLSRLLDAGVDVVRFNFSHGNHETHGAALELVRGLADARGRHVAALADLGGPKVRTGEIDPAHGRIEPGETCVIVRHPVQGTARRFGTTWPSFVDDVKPGERILIDDGTIRLEALERRPDELICRCVVGGTILSRKGLNAPDSTLSLPPLTEKDLADAAFAVRAGFDFFAQSFVRRAEDVVALRAYLSGHGATTPILAKIETPQAVAALDAIVEAADGLLVARGDLGVEMDVAQIPMLQKDMIRRCRSAGKPVIVATQMLQSMVESPTPTRAEVSDVANAVLDGADAVMLSAESAVGRFPVEAVEMMRRICLQAGEFEIKLRDRRGNRLLDDRLRVGHLSDQTASAVARSAALVAHDCGSKLVAVWSGSGRTARYLSKYRIVQPLVVLSADPRVCRQMSLCFGVHPTCVPAEMAEGRTPWTQLERDLAQRFGLQTGDVIVVVGDPTALKRRSTLALHVVGD